MATERASVNYPSTLLEEWLDRAGLSAQRATAIVTVLQLALLLVAAYMDGVLAELASISVLRSAVMFPAITAYIVLTQPVGRRLRTAAISALRPLVPVGDDEFLRLLAREPLFNRRRECLTMVLGAAVVLLYRPWESLDSWLTVYQVAAGALMFGLLGWIVASSLAATRLGAGWNVAEDISVFELQRLQPIARWSLGNAIFYIGGITLSLLFLGRFVVDLLNVAIYGVLTSAAVAVFFSGMRSTHRLMLQAKEGELERVSRTLAAASRALQEREDRAEQMAILINLALWRTYEKQVEELPDWPYTDEIRRSLLVSMLLPLAAYIIPALALQALQRLLLSP
jgi:hypothetical protein